MILSHEVKNAVLELVREWDRENPCNHVTASILDDRGVLQFHCRGCNNKAEMTYRAVGLKKMYDPTP